MVLVIKLQQVRVIISALALGGFAVSSFAIDARSPTVDNLGGDIQLGPVTAYPSMKIITRYSDNLYSSNSNKKSTLIGIVEPAVKLLLEDNIKTLTLDYSIQSGAHTVSSADNYADQKLLGVFEYHPTTKLKMAARLEYLDEHDPRGTARTEGVGVVNPLNLDPDEWHSYGIGGQVSYGSPNATGSIELETNYIAKEYDNNRQFTFTRDRNDFNLRGTFYYKIRSATQLLFEVNQTVYDYENSFSGSPSLDSTDRDYLFGVTWERTAKTTGFVKFGYTEKDFDSDLRNDTSGIKWQTGTRWRPRTYSTVDISTERRQDETNGIGDSIDVGDFKVSWNHEWRDRISSNIDFVFGEDDYTSSVREDTRFRAGLMINYDWQRWLRMSAGCEYEQRDSNVDTFDYERNLLDFRVNLTL
ncbi:MAG: hypothetical protein ACI9XC_001884 [Gammaproteobacteria bacterium]|jgi:hypothetical protein